jgi:putative FmdB family regulatory protein
MPTYEYVCSSCGNAWEEIQRITEAPVEECPSCHKATAKRQISGGTFILKGGGWYSDLYSSAKPSAAKDEASSKPSDTKTDTKAETKSETTTETKKSQPPKGDSGSSSGSSGSSGSGGGGSTGSGGSSKAAAE